ncbi:MAG: UvrD-helicase domain-containing protein [Planctomycetota bacterium]
MAAGNNRTAVARDADARAQIIASTDQSMLVEAAAGTGKTTLIVDRILQGILDGAFRLGATVAITFTEKAAGELETRLRARLTDALHGAAPASEARERLRAALQEIDRAQISTIHAFCARILKEKAAEAGVDPEFAVIDEVPAEVLRERCWQEWMGQQVAACPEPLVESLRAEVRVAELKEMAFALAGAPEILEPGRFRLAVPAEGQRECLGAACRLAPEARAFFRKHMKRGGNPDSRRLRDLVGELADAGPGDEQAARRLAYGIAAVRVDEALKSIDRSVREEAARVFGELNAAAMALGAHLCAEAFTWLAGFVAHYAGAKAARSVLDFQDLLLLAARLLRERPSVRRYFQHRFDAVFVDEFQDTDPLQAEMIACLCERPAGSAAGTMDEVRLADGKLFAVGDPKQSIYRFRRADVQIYDRFKRLFGPQSFGEERIRQIYCNFRSRPELLAWFNSLFERLFEAPDGEGIYQASHVPLEPPVGAEGQRARGPCVVALCAPPELPAGEWLAPVARRHEAHFLAHFIRSAVEGTLLPGDGEFAWGDFALLFRALTDVDIYEQALARCGIPYRVVGGKHFYRREQVVETLSVLRAVDDPLNEAAVVGALRSTFFGVSDEELFRYRERGGQWNYLVAGGGNGPAAEAIRLLARWHERRNSVPPQVLLREIFEATRAPQAFLMKPAGPQRVANLEKLTSQLRSLGAAAGNFGAVVRHLSALHEAEMPEEESSVVEPGDDFVRLMSMHKAKGLEFGVVVLPDLSRELNTRRHVGRLLFNRLDGRIALALARGIRSDDYEDLAAREAGNERAELRRLFYVACTRARRMLALSLYWSRDARGETFQDVLVGSGRFAAPDEVPFGQEQEGVYYLDAPEWADQVDMSVGPHRPPAEEDEDVELLMGEREQWLESHRRLAREVSAAEPFVLPSAMEAGIEFSHVFEESPAGVGGRDFGSLFHGLMMAVPLGAARDVSADLVRNLARVQAGHFGADDAVAQEAAELALRALANGEFRALLDGADSVAREVGFCVPLRRLPICADDVRGFLEGSIDLLLCDGGRTAVLDYKTDRFKPGQAEAVAERYWPQLALYAMAAAACGRTDGEPELALFFVRPGIIVRRPLDGELVAQVAAKVARQLAAAEG